MNHLSAQLSQEPIYLAQVHVGEGEAHSVTESTAVNSPHASAESTAAPQTYFLGLSLAAFLLIIIAALVGARHMKPIPGKFQNFLEWLVEILWGIPEMVMGPRGREYAPLIGTFFLYIVVMNMTGLIPFFKSGTASLSVTLGLSTFAFLAVQYYGFKAHGISYLKHFLGPVPAMAILLLPLELIAEIVRIASLSVRLYGNINGEEQVVEALANQLHWSVPVFILPLQILTIVLQAFVFSLLVAVYISLATEKHDDDHGAPGEAAAH